MRMQVRHNEIIYGTIFNLLMHWLCWEFYDWISLIKKAGTEENKKRMLS